MGGDAGSTPEAGAGGSSGDGGAPSTSGSEDAGAQSSAGDGGSDGSQHGGTVDVTGGTVLGSDGASVIVPSGALGSTVFIDIAEDASSAPGLPTGMAALGPIYAFTPHGIHFAKPVTVYVPFNAPAVSRGLTPVLLQAEPGGTFAQIPAQVDGSVMSASVSSFSWFVVAQIGTIAAGDDATCALAGGGVKCWGDNSVGQLGDGTTTTSATPIYVQGLPLVASALPRDFAPSLVYAVAANFQYSCALLGAGYGVMCWGQSPTVPSFSSKKPITVPGLAYAYEISAGVGHACARLPGGLVECWGDNQYGQLGDGSTNGSDSPVTVSGLKGAVAISANGHTSCAVLDDGSARCWGQNDSAQLGDGSSPDTNAKSTSPVTVTGLAGAAASISLGWNHGCALLTDGTVRCWGAGEVGQLGDGSNMRSRYPVAVSGLTHAVAISAGFDSTCALLSDGTVECWGHGKPLSTVPGLTGVATISVGFEHQCAMLTDGTARCWGENQKGGLGDGLTKASKTPVFVALGNDTVASGGAGGAGGMPSAGGTTGSGGAGGTTGSSGAGGINGVNGFCSNLMFNRGASGYDCTVSQDDGNAVIAMNCSPAYCQCYADGVAFGAQFDVGLSPCDNAVASFQDMLDHCGCP